MDGGTLVFSHKSAGEILATTYAPVEYVVDGLLPTGLAILAGAGKIGKSWLVLQLSVAIATERRFLDRDTHKGRALYLALEDNEARIQRRLLRQDVSARDGELVSIATAVDRDYDTMLADIESWIDAEKGVPPHHLEFPARLVVIDTLGRAMPDKPSGQDDYRHFVRILGKLQALALHKRVAVLMTHHVRKDGSVDPADPFDVIHGSQAIMATADTPMVLTRPRQAPEGRLLVTGRDVEEKLLNVRFDDRSCLWVAAMPTPMHALGVHGRRAEVLAAVAAGVTSSGEIASRLGMTASNLANRTRSLKDDGLLVRTTKGEYALAPHVADRLGGQPVTTEQQERSEGPEPAQPPPEDEGFIDSDALLTHGAEAA